MTHHVYTFWADREPLYVGCTNDLPRRMKQHAGQVWSRTATHISSFAFDDAGSALAGVVDQISSLRPTYNVHHNPRRQNLCDLLDAVSDEDMAWGDEACAATIARLWNRTLTKRAAA